MSAAMHEVRVYLASHPVVFGFAEATRKMGDIVDVPGVARIVNRPELAREILLDGEHFSKSGPGSFGALITQVMGESALLNMDSDAHHRLRSRLQDLFAPAYLETIARDVLEAPIAELRARLAGGESIDLVRFMQHLTGRTTCHMLGLPAPAVGAEQTYFELFAMVQQMSQSIGLATKKLTPAQVAAKKVPFERLTAAVAGAYERDDLPPNSVLARLKDLGLSADEARGVVGMLLVVGTETMTTAVPRTVALLVDSGQLSDLRSEPKLMQSAIDEALRFVVPSPVMVRSVSGDVTIGRHRFAAGQRVMLFTYNLLKHPDLYPRPRRFDIRREQPACARNIWFGAGPHFCLGFGLAQREMRMVLGALIGLPKEIEVVRRTYARRVLVPGYSRLEVRTRT
jgi:cytochrome P450